MTDYPDTDADEPTMPAGWPQEWYGTHPEADEPPVDKTTGEVLDGVIVERSQSEPPDRWQVSELSAQLAEAGGVAMFVMRDPEQVRQLSAAARSQLLGRVSDLAAIHRAERPRGRVTSAMLAPELNALSDANDVLDTIAGVFLDGAKLAKRLVGEVTHELADDPRRGSSSVKVADRHGQDLKVTRNQPTEVKVDADELIDVLVADLLTTYGVGDAPRVFAAGARTAIAAYRRLATSHTFKTTELDAWVRDLEAAERYELSIRAGHAYGRVAKGEPSVKIERVSRKGDAAAGEQTDEPR